jgi:hypothetical protein
MKQILITNAVFLGLVLIMSISVIFKGRALRKSCGSIISDSSDCLVCDKGKEPEKCVEED